MRKLEEKMIELIKDKTSGRSGKNTEIKIVRLDIAKDSRAEILLHGNLIATYYYMEDIIFLYTAGWTSRTTKSRLNSLLNGLGFIQSVKQKNFKWYVCDREFEEGVCLSK